MPLAGGIMNGDIGMGTHEISNLVRRGYGGANYFSTEILAVPKF